MTNLIVGLVILAVVGGAVVKIINEKKKGSRCMGCPYSDPDNENCSCSITELTE